MVNGGDQRMDGMDGAGREVRPGLEELLSMLPGAAGGVGSAVRGMDRRGVMRLVGGLWVASGLVGMGGLGGCASAPKRASDDLPDVTWPDQKTGVLSPLPPPSPVASGPAPAMSENYDRPPGVMARGTWTSKRVIAARTNPMHGVRRITVHHDALDAQSLRTRNDAMKRLTAVQSTHMRQGWADIGYHYVIDPQGNVWEGRPLFWQGAHVKDNNEHNLGVMCMGNFDRHRPTSAQIRALDSFVASLMRQHRVALANVRTHQEIKPTACPGRNLQGYMVSTRGRSGQLARMA